MRPTKKNVEEPVLFADWNCRQRSSLCRPWPRSTAHDCSTMNFVPRGGRCTHWWMYAMQWQARTLLPERSTNWAQIERSAQEGPWERLPVGYWAKRSEAMEPSGRNCHLRGESQGKGMLLKAGLRGVRRGDRWRGRLRGGESQAQPEQTFVEAATLSQRAHTRHFKPSNFHDLPSVPSMKNCQGQSVWDWKAVQEGKASGNQGPVDTGSVFPSSLWDSELKDTAIRWLSEMNTVPQDGWPLLLRGERGLPGKKRKRQETTLAGQDTSERVCPEVLCPWRPTESQEVGKEKEMFNTSKLCSCRSWNTSGCR